jgi:hypothetical protein
VAAKRIQMYAEENLESHNANLKEEESPNNNGEVLVNEEVESATASTEKNNGSATAEEEKPSTKTVKRSVSSVSSNQGGEENLAKMLQMAKIKVNEAELAKQSSDIEQIVAGRLYEDKRVQVERLEKSLRKQIEKSREYFELKAAMNKELRFLFTKIEGLKSCLKEAKFAYQQSLKNLELISTEIHSLRQQRSLSSGGSLSSSQPPPLPQSLPPNLVSQSSSTLSSSSSSISFQDQQQQRCDFVLFYIL